MILPKGQAVNENMNTSYTNLGELLLNLNTNSFTGYVQLSFLEYEGILFLDSGKIVNAVEETADRKRTTGQKAVTGITKKAQEKEGNISVYTLSAEMVVILASVVRNEVVYKDLTTELTTLEKLFEKLKNEEHTGYIEVEMNDQKGNGIIFIQTGEPIECIFSTNGKAVSGIQALPQIVKQASESGANFNVYKATAKEVFGESTEIMAGFELPQLLEVWQDILASVERVADGLSSNGHFLDMLKDSLIEKATDYPFLDPFRGQFQYKDGKASYSGDSLKNFSQALGDCLIAAINKLADEMPEADAETKIKSEFQAIKKKHAEAINKFALEMAIPKYLA